MELPDAVAAIEYGEIVIAGEEITEACEIIKPRQGESLADFATRLTTQWPDGSLRLKIKRGRPEYAIRRVM